MSEEKTNVRPVPINELSIDYEIGLQSSLDARLTVDSVEMLNEPQSWYRTVRGQKIAVGYKGMPVSCKEDASLYVLQSDAAELTSTDWEKVATQEWVKREKYATIDALDQVKADIPTIPTNVSEFTNDAGYLVEQDLTGYAKEADIPTIPTNVSEFTNDAGYLVEQDLTGYAQTSEIPTIPTNVSSFENDAGYATTKALEQMKDEILGEGITETYDTLVEIQNWINGAGVNATELTEAIATETQNRKDADSALGNRVQVIEDTYITEEKLPDVSNFITKEVDNLTNYYTKSEVDEAIENVEVDLTGYATEQFVISQITEIPQVDISGKLDISVYEAEKVNFATTGALDQVKADIPTIPTNVSEFTNDAGYLVEQDLTGYAKEADIPTIPTNVSEFTNDAGYLVEQDLTGYAKEEDIANNYITKAAFTYKDGVLTIKLD